MDPPGHELPQPSNKNMNEILAKVYRGDTVESVHCGSVAVVDSEGKLIYSFGDPYFVTYLRSSAKPFQVIPLITSGAARDLVCSKRNRHNLRFA